MPLPEIFEADNLLAEHLLSLGYTDVTTARNKAKGKRQFRHPTRRTKQVYFDYINVRLQHRSSFNWSGIKLNKAGFQFWHEHDVNQKMLPELKRLAEAVAPSASHTATPAGRPAIAHSAPQPPTAPTPRPPPQLLRIANKNRVFPKDFGRFVDR